MNTKMTEGAYQEALAVHAAGHEWNRYTQEDIVAHIAAVTAERDEARREAKDDRDSLEKVLVERNATRERVRLLEAEVRSLRAWPQTTRAIAPPEAFTHEKGLDAGVVDEDALRPVPGFAMPPPEVQATIQRDASGATTSEAFATVREGLDLLPDQAGTPYVDRIRSALSLLEHRMGVLELAARSICAHLAPEEQPVFSRGDLGIEDPSGINSALTDLHAALTGAPPVFTLEEATRAMLDAAKQMKGDDTPTDFRDYVREILTARRGQ